MQENEIQNILKRSEDTARRAVKISLVACVVVVIFTALSLWILLNQITATANLVKIQKEYETRLESLEKSLK